jgi:hypothetical protein
MGSPLSLVVANLFMEHFEIKALDFFSHRPKWWLRCFDDVYSNWPHGENKLGDVTNHLNNQSKSIKFNVEKEENMCLPLLDVLTKKKQDVTLVHQVYKKGSHTNRYLHTNVIKTGSILAKSPILTSSEAIPVQLKALNR